MLDFFDDYTQIKHILPLKKTQKKLKELNLDSLYEEAAERLKKNYSSKKDRKKENEQQDYFDIYDEGIDEIIKSIQN